MSFNRSSNKGWGNVGNVPKQARRVCLDHLIRGDNVGVDWGLYGDKVKLSQLTPK